MSRYLLPGGVFAANLTPLASDLSIDHDALVAHVQWLLRSGCSGIALFGTTGEATSFSVAERMAGLDALIEAGVDAQKMLVGTGCCALPDSVALTRHALSHGVGGMLMLPPFYYKGVSDEGLFAAFDQVIQQVGEEGLEIYLYHFPKMSQVPFSHALIERLLNCYPKTIVGMKDSSGDFKHMQSIREAFPGFRLFAGTERYLLDVLKIGGVGCISATANVTCTLAGQVYANWQKDEAIDLQEHLTQVRHTIEQYPAIPALKNLMATWREDTDWAFMRPPLAALPAGEAQQLKDALEALDFAPAF